MSNDDDELKTTKKNGNLPCGESNKSSHIELMQGGTGTGGSPTTIGASNFSANFEENGYVFDGVKIDVIQLPTC